MAIMAVSSRWKSKPAAKQRYLIGLIGECPMRVPGLAYAISHKEVEELGGAEYEVTDTLKLKLVARLAGSNELSTAFAGT